MLHTMKNSEINKFHQSYKMWFANLQPFRVGDVWMFFRTNRIYFSGSSISFFSSGESSKISMLLHTLIFFKKIKNKIKSWL